MANMSDIADIRRIANKDVQIHELEAQVRLLKKSVQAQKLVLGELRAKIDGLNEIIEQQREMLRLLGGDE